MLIYVARNYLIAANKHYMKIDLRSDTVTKPSEGMLAAMMEAQVGDDVFGEDPAVNELESLMAQIFKQEGALYCPTGTMANQIAIKCHTQPGEEVICDEFAHVYTYEGGGIALNSGCQARPLPGLRGLLSAEEIEAAINPDDVHRPKTSLVVLENTSNRGGGACYEWKDILAIKEVCRNHGLRLHLDGARLFNAIVAKHQNPALYGEVFDSISVCLSKGLGAPVGSLLIGNAEFIAKARRYRKVFGGGMRQAGYMAAAGNYALHHNIGRLKDDHRRAKDIAAKLMEKNFVGKIRPVETNIVIYELVEQYTAREFCSLLLSYDVHCLPINNKTIRMVTHLDYTEEMHSQLLNIFDAL